MFFSLPSSNPPHLSAHLSPTHTHFLPFLEPNTSLFYPSQHKHTLFPSHLDPTHLTYLNPAHPSLSLPSPPQHTLFLCPTLLYPTSSPPSLSILPSPAHTDLSPSLLLSRCRLHLLDLYRVGFTPALKQVVVADAQVQNELVHARVLGEKDKVGRCLVGRSNGKFAVVYADVADFGPREADFGLQFVFALVDVETQCSNSWEGA